MLKIRNILGPNGKHGAKKINKKTLNSKEIGITLIRKNLEPNLRTIEKTIP
jgi:hypothetical protein